MKILIVDDDPSVRRIAESILREKGYETESAESVKRAVTEIESGDKISIILLDINMPGESGYALLKYLKTMHHDERIPVIMCSSSEDEQSVMQSINLGAVDYLIKPITAENLLPKITNVISRHCKTVLIVDDEKIIRNLLVATFEREGYHTFEADSGEKALKTLSSHKIDAVISDIQMDNMNGLELLNTIKTNYKNMPVLMITGHSGRYSKYDILDAGADGYITKPFKNLEILKALDDVLKKSSVL